jgi:1-acyl-sn-glycerol-3-phosphate acyltransferase
MNAYTTWGNRLLQLLFFIAIVHPLVLLIIGLRIHHKQGLPKTGPAILVANHNSHLDTWVLMTLFPLGHLHHLRPVAAADYFLTTPFKRWFFRRIFHVIAMERGSRCSSDQRFAECDRAIAQGDILIVFPEGSRGTPEERTAFKSGIAHLSQRHPDVPLYPIFLHGLGKALPKGDFLLVPFFCDVFIGTPCWWSGNKEQLITELNQQIQALATEGYVPPWT